MKTRFFLILIMILQLLLLSSSQPSFAAARERQPEAAEVVIEEPAITPPYGGGMCDSGWRRYDNDRGHAAYLALNSSDPLSVTNRAEWNPTLPITGAYKVEAYIPTHASMNWQCPTKTIGWDSSAARYTIQDAESSKTVSGNQAPLSSEWLDLGTYNFNAGSQGQVALGTLTGETAQSKTVSFSAVRFTLVLTDFLPAYNTLWLTDFQLAGEYDTTSSEAMRAFLQEQKSCLAAPLLDADGKQIDIPAVVHEAAVKYKINPKVILATMEKEQSAITRCPETWRLQTLMGLAPTTARLQIMVGAGLLRADFDQISQSGESRNGWQVGSAKETQDGVSVTPATKAIAGQLTYTPYAGENWGGNLPGKAGVWAFYHAWQTFGFDQPLPEPPPACSTAYFSQQNPGWKDHLLDTDGNCPAACSTIGSCGCTLTSAAMLYRSFGAELDPASLSDCMAERACPFSWPGGAGCSQDKAQWQGLLGFSWSRLDEELNTHQRPVILGISRGEDRHWVLAVRGSGSRASSYWINDPWPLNGVDTPLTAYTQRNWVVDHLAVYSGTLACENGIPLTGTLPIQGYTPPRFLAAFDPQAAGQIDPLISIQQASQLETTTISGTQVVTGNAVIYAMTGTTMTVDLIASSTATGTLTSTLNSLAASTTASVTHVLAWTEQMTQTNWQDFSTFAALPLADFLYVRFKDAAGNISGIVTTTSYPRLAAPMRHEIFLPLFNKNAGPASCAAPFFSQQDPLWRNQPLGNCKEEGCNTIWNCGCALTSAAMLFNFYGADTNPGDLNACLGSKACPIAWADSASQCSQGKAQWVAKKGFSWSLLDQELNQTRHPVLLGMSKKDKTHWVLVVSGSGSQASNYVVNDPWPLNGVSTPLTAQVNLGYSFDWIAVYNGPVSCGSAAPAARQPALNPPQFLAAFDPEAAGQGDGLISIQDASRLGASGTISGTAMLYQMTGMTMTLRLEAAGAGGPAKEMMLWTDKMTTTNWQDFSTYVALPLSEYIFVRFKDAQGNISEVIATTSFPTAFVPTDD